MQVIVKDRIDARPEDVFDKIQKSRHLCGFFVSESSGDLKSNEQINWTFGDANAQIDIIVKEVKPNEKISFQWQAGAHPTEVGIDISADGAATIIRISEGEFDSTAIKKMMEQTQGWTDFLCSLKAYIYTGINLRRGRIPGSY